VPKAAETRATELWPEAVGVACRAVRTKGILMILDVPQHELLAALVETERSIPRHLRGKFLVLPGVLGSPLVSFRPPTGGPGVNASFRDAEDLEAAGLLRISYGSGGSRHVWVTPEGFKYYENMRSTNVPAEGVETSVQTYLSSSTFQLAYPSAYKKWQAAERLLWSSDSRDQLSTIGHLCREAMQGFAAELATNKQVEIGALGTTQIVARIRAVLGATKVAHRTGNTTDEFLAAILAYWGAVSDCVQRQEHSAAKESEDLLWEDARRVVFHTMIVMYELDRATAR
jgi:hypothetical protein